MRDTAIADRKNRAEQQSRGGGSQGEQIANVAERGGERQGRARESERLADDGRNVAGQSDLAQAENLNYQLSDEVDENGHQFVLNSEGSVEFGRIGDETGLKPAPILLSEGIITNPNTNAGYGLLHIEARHGEQIRAAGYKSVLEFIEEVAKNYEIIREGNSRDGLQTYMLQLTDKHNNTLMVELSGDGTYWNINTAGIFKTSYGVNRTVVYSRHTTANQPAETDEASLSGEQSGTTPSTRMNASAQAVDVSDSKDIEKSHNSNELGEKVMFRRFKDRYRRRRLRINLIRGLPKAAE